MPRLTAACCRAVLAYTLRAHAPACGQSLDGLVLFQEEDVEELLVPEDLLEAERLARCEREKVPPQPAR
jgi:hypothetical protein